MKTDDAKPHWDEQTSETYLDYGKYFIPDREQQMMIMVDLVKAVPHLELVLELCCGEGLLAEQVLEALPKVHYQGLDGSTMMVKKANQRLLGYRDRAQVLAFELATSSWRRLDQPVQAVVSSLAIHHLDGEEKLLLFKDIYTMLDVGGVFIIADMIEPVTRPGRSVAADAWDEVVRERSIQLGNNKNGLEFFLREHWNTYRYPDPEDIDHPSPLFHQLKWLEQSGFTDIDAHFMRAGHALFSAWK